MLMASIEIKYLWDFIIGIMGLLGGTLAGLFMLGIFTRKVGVIHAWIGVIASICTLLYVKLGTDLNRLLYGVIGVMTCFVIACLFSRIFPTGIMKMAGLTIYDIPESQTNSESP
jgi:hypothetical protein